VADRRGRQSGYPLSTQFWDTVRALAERQGAPSPQALMERLVSDLIQLNAKVQPKSPVRIKLAWLTYGIDATQSPEAALVFHDPTCASIGELWQLPEAKARDVMAGLILRSIEAAVGPSTTA
jgi:predicted DNA-binding ribbon-helix-helix protein